MTLKRTSNGKPGRPRVVLDEAQISWAKELASQGHQLLGIAENLGIGIATLKRLMREHPVLKNAIAEGHKLIGYEAVVMGRRQSLLQEAEEAGQDPEDIDTQVFTTEELQKIFAGAVAGVALANLHAYLGLPVGMFDALLKRDRQRAERVYQRGVQHFADLISRDFKERDKPKALPTAPIHLDDHVLQLAADHAALLFESDETECEPDLADMLS